MKDDGGLGEAISGRRTLWTEETSDVERHVLDRLASSVEAAEAWRDLGAGIGRWKATVLPEVVLELVTRSALFAAMRDEVRAERETIEDRYRHLFDAAQLVFEYFLDALNTTEEEFGRRDPWNEQGDEVAHARHMDGVLDYLVIAKGRDLVDLHWLPRPPKSRGPGAEARSFEYFLTELLNQTYGRAFDGFALAVSAVLYPEADMAVPEKAARYRGRERQKRLCEEEAWTRREREYEEFMRSLGSAGVNDRVQPDPFAGDPPDAGRAPEPDSATRRRWLMAAIRKAH